MICGCSINCDIRLYFFVFNWVYSFKEPWLGLRLTCVHEFCCVKSGTVFENGMARNVQCTVLGGLVPRFGR